MGGADRWASTAVSSSLCTASLRTTAQTFPALEGFRSLSHSRLAMKVAPGLSGTASTLHDLIFLLKGPTWGPAWGDTKSLEQELQTEHSLSSFDGVALSKSLTSHILQFCSERVGLSDP